MTTMTDEQQKRPGAFFGRRKGHPLRARQAALIETLLPHLAIDLTKPAPADLRTLFPGDVEDVRMESGFGGGERLIAEALAHPESGFIGAEPFVNGMAKALVAIDEHGLTNIRLHHADAVPLLDWLPAGQLARFDLFYPDPWPKRRHWKRRFVSDENVARIARVLRPGAHFRFATDWDDYASWTLQRLLPARAFEWTAERADDWRKPWPGFDSTRYEAKAFREGRTPCYLTFRRG
jgi:tRNA (guanine-N7-)-methyltransferase